MRPGRPPVSIEKTLIFVPTYNERENARLLADQIVALGLDADLLFVDDNSPDGTGQVLDEMAARNPRLHVVHRSGKLGIGTAHVAGITWAYDHGYTRLVSMDCDFTHSPSDIPRLLERSAESDVVVGSRWLQQGSLEEWGLFRKVLTSFGHFLTRRLLKMPYDATGAFRVYNLTKIPRYAFAQIESGGYAFFFESLFLLARNGFSVQEVPISLPARTYGHSKMSWREASRSGLRVIKLYLATLLNPEPFTLVEPPPDINPALVDPQHWDAYWEQKKRAGSLLYEVIATAYRNMVIKRRLNRVIRRHFPGGARLLHGGCGSGHVDRDLQHEVSITAVDISVPALALYRRNIPKAHQVKHASILDLPFADASFDGAYNLGVVEHFTEEDIRRILAEFYRVVRPGGKVVIFWPHAWATSVMVLDSVQWLLSKLLRRTVSLYPAEITRVKSKAWAKAHVAGSGFDFLEYHFGAGDLFVQAVLVLEKPGDERPAGDPPPSGGAAR